MKRLHRLSLVLSLVAGAAALPACTTNPATGKKNFNVISKDQEKALGAQAEPQFLKEYGGDIPSAEVRRYVSDIGHRLASLSERPELDWEFHVIDSAVINAFALPGGKVFMSRALMEKMTNEAQLAGVLGHEIGHVTAMHINQQMSQAIALQVGGVALGVAGGVTNNQWLRVMGVGTQAGGTLYMLKFGRDQESQADELGVRYMTRAGYNPVGQLQVMKILKEASGSGGGAPEFLSTHPLPQTRIDRLEKLIKEKYKGYKKEGRYVFNADQFRENALEPLAQLPPPKHNPARQGKAAR